MTKNTDRDLLELAANAAGYTEAWCPDGWTDTGPWRWHETLEWNPLMDDGDSARLEAALSLNVYWYPAMVLVGPEVCSPSTGSAYAGYYDKHGGDRQAARRYAGVRAAAEIGKLTEAQAGIRIT